VWERRLWWYMCVALVAGAGILLGEFFVTTRTRAGSSLGTTIFRPNQNQFSWLFAPHGAGVAACDLVVEGFDMLAFGDTAAVHACMRNKSVVFVGDSVTRCVLLGGSLGWDQEKHELITTAESALRFHTGISTLIL